MSPSNGNLLSPGFSFKRTLTRSGSGASNISAKSGASTKSSSKSPTSAFAKIGSVLRGHKGKEREETPWGNEKDEKPDGNFGADDAAALKYHLAKIVNRNHLERFYSDKDLELLAADLAANGPVRRIQLEWNLSEPVALDFTALALYDIVLLLDDSTSMTIGSRTKDLASFCADIAFAASLFDQNGFSMRWLNSRKKTDNIVDPKRAKQAVQERKMDGLTYLGPRLRDVLEEFVYGPERRKHFHKPVQIIIITDGEPSFRHLGEFEKELSKLYREFNASRSSERSETANRTIAIQVAQVGDDQAAREYLGSLDGNCAYGDIIDCTSSFESEAQEAKIANMPTGPKLQPFYLTHQLWLTKLLLGAINSDYDSLDEARKGKWGSGGPSIIVSREQRRLTEEEESQKEIERMKRELETMREQQARESVTPGGAAGTSAGGSQTENFTDCPPAYTETL